MIIEWPTGLSPRIINLRLINKTRSAGESITGFEQVAGSLATRWAFSLEFNNLKRHLIPAYRAMVASLEGRANALRVPVFDPQFWPSDAVIGIASVPHSDGTPLSDGSEYLTTDVDGITATGLKGAKVLTVDFGAYGPIFDGGLYFGVEEETYLSTSVQWAGSVATIRFQPGLRQDHTAAQFRLRPRLLMRLVDDQGGELALERGIIGAPSLELVEILPDELSLLEGGA
jgi:hypothetical protein